MDREERFHPKREFKRKKIATKVGVLCRGQFSLEQGVEIGEGGMLLRTRKFFKIGDHLEINFSIPGGGYVSSSAEVLYLIEPTPGEFYFGLKFLDPATILKLEIRHFVEPSPD
jgi:hypothetical protein